MFKPMIRFFVLYGLFVIFMATKAQAETITGVGLGDSLMAGYQLNNGEGFPDQLQKALQGKGYDVSITNAGVSGDTSSGGLARLDWSVQEGTDFVILELGGNDALRGIKPEITKNNLDEMIQKLKKRNIDVLLVGMIAPPNMGEEYAKQFNSIYRQLADKHSIPLYPFFLEGVITQPELMLNDAIHPNAQGVSVMVENFMPYMTNYLEQR